MRKTPSDDKNVLLADLIAARENLLAVVSSLPPGCQDASCIGTWSVKDLVAHLVGWDLTNLQAVNEILAGQRPSFFQYYDPDWQHFNARLVETYRKEPFDALLSAAADSHQQFLAFLQSLPPDTVLKGKSPKELGRSVTIRNLLLSEAADERKHCEQVLAFGAKVRAETLV
jgi:hypothetical protein